MSERPSGTDPLLASSFPYLEPVGKGVWKPVTVQRDGGLSFSYCSAYAITDRDNSTRRSNPDIARVGGCAR